jgi:hypothetical protein
VGSQAATALPVSPLGADHRPRHEGGEKTDKRIEEIVELKRIQECHYATTLQIPPQQEGTLLR